MHWTPAAAGGRTAPGPVQSSPTRWPTVEWSEESCTWLRRFWCSARFLSELWAAGWSHRFCRRHSTANPAHLAVRTFCTGAGFPISRRRTAEGTNCNPAYRCPLSNWFYRRRSSIPSLWADLRMRESRERRIVRCAAILTTTIVIHAEGCCGLGEIVAVDDDWKYFRFSSEHDNTKWTSLTFLRKFGLRCQCVLLERLNGERRHNLKAIKFGWIEVIWDWSFLTRLGQFAV